MATQQKLQNDFLTCQICFEVYQQPCTLNCEHTYCKACLTRYIQTQPDAIKAKTIPCPSCRRHISVPNPDRPVTEWAGQFKTSLVIQGLMDSFAHHQGEDCCLVCQSDGKKVLPSHWCADCEASLCDSCLTLHNKMPLLCQHYVLPLSEETSNVKMKKRKYICKQHDEKIKLFCKDCRKTLCTVCCSIKHRGCKEIVTIQEMLPHVKIELEGRQKRIMDVTKQVFKHKTEHEQKLHNTEQKAVTLQSTIKQTFKEVISLLQKKEIQLLSKVDDITDKQTQELKAKVNCEDITIQTYQQQSQFIQQALKHEDEAQLYEMYLSPESETDIIEPDSERRSNTGDASFNNNIKRIREEIDMMDVMAVCDDVIDLTVTPVLEDIVATKRADDRNGPGLRDAVILHRNGITTVVVTDYGNQNVKSFYRTRGKYCSSELKTDSYPWSLAVLSQSKVIVSVPQSKQILIVDVNPDLVLQSTISTSKEYWGLSVLDQSTLVAGSKSPPSVDVLDMTGNVLRSFTTLTSIQKSFKNPYYLHVTHQGNIVVSDWGLKSVICLTTTGEVVFHYSHTCDRKLVFPYGTTSATRGDILLADHTSHKVVHLTQSGEFVQNILTSQNGLQNPIGLCVDESKLYVATRYYGVHIFRFSQKKRSL